MIIHKIIFINFKHYKNQSFLFKSGINAIIGENNAGKTSLLYSIAGIFNLPFGGNIMLDFPTMLRNPPFTTRFELELYLTQEEWYSLFKLREFDLTLNERLSDTTLQEISKKIQEMRISIQLRMEIEVILKEQREIKWGGIPRDEINLINLLKNDFIQKLEIENLEDTKNTEKKVERYFNVIISNYINSPSNFPYKPKIILPYLSEFQKSEPYTGFIGLQNNLRGDYKGGLIRSKLYHLKRNNWELFNKFKERMESNFPIIEGVEINLNDYSGNFDLTLDNYGRDITIFGGGTQTFAKIFSAISLEDSSVVLLDEPDSHLHASLANDLTSYLLDLGENKQIIFTTHLPNLIDSIPQDSIIILRLEGESTEIKWIQEASDLFNQMELMGLSPTNYQRALMNRAETIVCLEGPTDQEFIEKFIERLAKTDNRIAENRKMIEFLHVGKLYSSDLNKLRSGFLQTLDGKKIVYIRDRDEDSDHEISNIKAFDGFPVHIWSYRQIESYLLDLEAITTIIEHNTSNLVHNFHNISQKIEDIIQEEKTKQFSKLLFHYVENEIRSKIFSPDNDLSITPEDSIEEINSAVSQAMISRRAITHLSPLVGNTINDAITKFILRWNNESLFMINAKYLLAAIRGEFNLNFRNKDIIEYQDNIPEEIHSILNDFIFGNN